MSRLCFMSLLLFSFFFLPWVSLCDPETKNNKSENENEGASNALSSAPRETETFLHKVKQELKAEFQVEMDALKSEFEGKLHQQRVDMTHDFEDKLQAELRAQRSEMTSQFEKQLKQQYDKLTRQCQHTVTESAPTQDTTLEMHASGMNENTHKRSDDLGPMETVVAQATQRLDQMDADIRALQSRDAELQNGVDAENQARGTTYTRWGSASCHNSSELVYSGILGGGIATDNTAPANYLCLTMDPKYGTVTLPSVVNANAVYGCEYELYGGVTENTAPACAVCRVPRSTSIMIPGTNRCTSGWNIEYTGHLMAGQRGGAATASTEYICVDAKHDYIPGTQNNDDQNVVHWVVTACGELPCPPYQDHKIATCVVCSK